MKLPSHQGETTKGSERMKTSFGPTVATEMQIKATVMSFSRLSDQHTHRDWQAQDCVEVGLPFSAEGQHRVPGGRTTSYMIVKDQEF